VTFGYDALRRLGVEVVIDKAKGIDTESRMVKLGGGILSYDKLIVAPGIDFRLDVVPGYDSNTAEQLPHAWIAGPATLKLARQIEAMADGGTVIICPPDNPYRCPPAPYERASLIANYLKKYKPRSKILILDAKETFSKQPLFQNAWDLLYPGMITWLAGTVGGAVERVDAAAMTVTAGFGSEKGAVINFIPGQQAGAIAREAGLADDSGWCPADPNTMASNKARDVYVIGDAVKAGILPKSGSVANTEGKAVAAAILAELGDHPPPEPVFANVCYSLAAPDYGFSTTAVYRLTEQGMVDTLQGIGVSPVEAAIDIRRQEAQFASGWYRAITADIWG
jgi:sulfide dehydrogenase [flavocytochrome c] flavoprotein subunit